MMRFVVLVLTGLLDVSLAGAEESVWVYPIGQGKEIVVSASCPIGNQVIDNLGRVFVCRGERGWELYPSDCEATMEAAMKAMEPFIMTIFQSQEEADRRITALQQAEELWAAAKKDCWRTP